MSKLVQSFACVVEIMHSRKAVWPMGCVEGQMREGGMLSLIHPKSGSSAVERAAHNGKVANSALAQASQTADETLNVETGPVLLVIENKQNAVRLMGCVKKCICVRGMDL